MSGKIQSFRKRVFDIIQIGPTQDRVSRLFDFFIAIVIVLNIAVLILETFQELEAYTKVLRTIETVTIVIFIIEYILRIWTADFLYPGMKRGKAVLRFIFSFYGIVDLLTILPFFYLAGFSALRILRVARIFHLFRVNSYSDSFNVITSVLVDKYKQILSSLLIIAMLMLFSSLCMYNVEHAAQPEAFSNVLSALWWSLSCIFTVGYGDIYPITILGRGMAVIITILGVCAVAIPTGIISAGFVEHYRKAEQEIKLGEYKKNTQTTLVDEESGYADMSVREIEKRGGIGVLSVIRDGNVLVPADELIIKYNDIMVWISEQQ